MVSKCGTVVPLAVGMDLYCKEYLLQVVYDLELETRLKRGSGRSLQPRLRQRQGQTIMTANQVNTLLIDGHL